MPITLFTDGSLTPPTGGLMKSATVLTSGGTLSQAAIAALTNEPQANGGVAEPAIVQPGLREKSVEINAETKTALMWVAGTALAAFVVWHFLLKGN